MKPASLICILSTALIMSSTLSSNLAACQRDLTGTEQAEMLDQQGWKHFQEGRYQEALKFFEMAYLSNPSDTYAYSMRNFCYQEAILKNRAAILSLQREISINNVQIEQLQNDCSTNYEITKALECAVFVNQTLVRQLHEEFAKHNDLLNGLRVDFLQSKEFAEQLQSAITENKEMLEEIKNQLLDTQEMQSVLVKYGNNPDGLTPFHYAIKTGNTHAVEMMINHEVSIDLRDGGYTPLHRAIEANQMEIASLLIRYGANVNARDECGYTPLQRAEAANQYETATFLLQHGADANAYKPTKNTIEPINEVDKPKIELLLKDTIDAAFAYHTAAVEQKVRVLFLKQYSRDQNNARHVQQPYRAVLMIEAVADVINEIEDLAKAIRCERQLWFWETAQNILNAKTTGGERQQADAFFKIKKATLSLLE